MIRDIPKKDPKDSWSTRLVLADGEKTKTMILNLVKGHGTNGLPQKDGLEVNDIVARKGKGLVILLYGMASLTLRRNEITCSKSIRTTGCW